MTSRLTHAQRYIVLGRVLLYFLACAVVLAIAAPLTKNFPGKWSHFVLGAVASLATFGLAALFVRWDGAHLKDIGVAPSRASPPRFAFGFLIGLLLVTLQSGIAATAGHARWMRMPGIGLAETAIAFFVYLLLSCREELAFRGYPLRRLE